MPDGNFYFENRDMKRADTVSTSVPHEGQWAVVEAHFSGTHQEDKKRACAVAGLPF